MRPHPFPSLSSFYTIFDLYIGDSPSLNPPVYFQILIRGLPLSYPTACLLALLESIHSWIPCIPCISSYFCPSITPLPLHQAFPSTSHLSSSLDSFNKRTRLLYQDAPKKGANQANGVGSHDIDGSDSSFRLLRVVSASFPFKVQVELSYIDSRVCHSFKRELFPLLHST